MTKMIVEQQVYFGGAIRAPGDEIEVDLPIDQKRLADKGLARDEKMVAEQQNKMAVTPANKAVEPAAKK